MPSLSLGQLFRYIAAHERRHLWQKEYRKRYQLRSKVAHGNIGVLPGEEEQEIIDSIPYLINAVVATLERMINGDIPSVVIERPE